MNATSAAEFASPPWARRCSTRWWPTSPRDGAAQGGYRFNFQIIDVARTLILLGGMLRPGNKVSKRCEGVVSLIPAEYFYLSAPQEFLVMLSRKSPVLLAILAESVLCVSRPCAADDSREITIENSPQKIQDGAIRAELHGVRTFTTSPSFLQSASSDVTIPTSVVVDAVKKSRGLQTALSLTKDPGELTFPKIAEAARLAQGKELLWEPSVQFIAGSYCEIPKGQPLTSRREHLKCDGAAGYNSETVAQLLMSGGLDTTSTIYGESDGHNIDLISVRPSFASVLISSNLSADNLKVAFHENAAGSFAAASSQFKGMLAQGANDPKIGRVAFLQGDSVTFGVPWAESPTEAKLEVPEEILQRFDVHLIHLAMTWRQLPRNNLSELDFSVRAPEGTIAFELIPFRYGLKVENKDTIQVSPTLELGGAKVGLGEIFGREVSFTYLKPTIQAYGLQESQFSWRMRDQAVQPGAEQFLCAVGVPKHSKELTLVMSASALWSGVFATAAGIESTEEVERKIPLQ